MMRFELCSQETMRNSTSSEEASNTAMPGKAAGVEAQSQPSQVGSGAPGFATYPAQPVHITASQLRGHNPTMTSISRGIFSSSTVQTVPPASLHSIKNGKYSATSLEQTLSTMTEATSTEHDGKPTKTTKKKIDRSKLRKGKWTAEEEEYTSRIIHYFSIGLLTLPEGTTLRSYLAEKLNCDPMRITKKYAGASCLGKRHYHLVDRAPATFAEIEIAKAELVQLEHLFSLRVQHGQGTSLPPQMGIDSPSVATNLFLPGQAWSQSLIAMSAGASGLSSPQPIRPAPAAPVGSSVQILRQTHAPTNASGAPGVNFGDPRAFHMTQAVQSPTPAVAGAAAVNAGLFGTVEATQLQRPSPGAGAPFGVGQIPQQIQPPAPASRAPTVNTGVFGAIQQLQASTGAKGTWPVPSQLLSSDLVYPNVAQTLNLPTMPPGTSKDALTTWAFAHAAASLTPLLNQLAAANLQHQIEQLHRAYQTQIQNAPSDSAVAASTTEAPLTPAAPAPTASTPVSPTQAQQVQTHTSLTTPHSPSSRAGAVRSAGQQLETAANASSHKNSTSRIYEDNNKARSKEDEVAGSMLMGFLSSLRKGYEDALKERYQMDKEVPERVSDSRSNSTSLGGQKRPNTNIERVEFKREKGLLTRRVTLASSDRMDTLSGTTSYPAESSLDDFESSETDKGKEPSSSEESDKEFSELGSSEEGGSVPLRKRMKHQRMGVGEFTLKNVAKHNHRMSVLRSQDHHPVLGSDQLQRNGQSGHEGRSDQLSNNPS